MLSVGVDIGGTFTDFVVLETRSERLWTAKILTTPDDPGEAFRRGLTKILADAQYGMSDVDTLIHGTTLATNALIERRGVEIAFLTTEGFTDVLEIARERRHQIYDILFLVPQPLVPRRRCIGVAERIGPDGSVILALDTERLLRDVERLIEHDGITSVAICFLHAYANPGHEREARGALVERFPQLFVSISSDLVSEPGEYERGSTVAANAYIQPIVRTYLSELDSGFRDKGFDGRFYVMLSDGGLGTPEFAARCATHIIESGPAGGVQLATSIAKSLGLDHALAFDMGGTTAKICVIRDFVPGMTNQFEVGQTNSSTLTGGGLPIKAPFIEMVEVGTGGGSIAGLNSLDLLSVGPASAGASPGPACYGLGGTMPTVTDADLVLGFLRDDYFAGGELQLAVDEAREAIRIHVAEPLGITVEKAAWAIHDVANETMANAARLHAAQRGCNLSAFTMIASGGAGPVHAGNLANRLGIRQVVFPRVAGVASALGFLLSPVSCVSERVIPQNVDTLDYALLNDALDQMERDARDAIQRARISTDDVELTYECSMSYQGQGAEIRVTLPSARLSEASGEQLKLAFEARYIDLYVRLIPALGIRIGTWRVIARGPARPLPAVSSNHIGSPQQADTLADGVVATRLAFDPVSGSYREHAVRKRHEIAVGACFGGPAIVESPESTIVVPNGMQACADRFGNLVVSKV